MVALIGMAAFVLYFYRDEWRKQSGGISPKLYDLLKENARVQDPSALWKASLVFVLVLVGFIIGENYHIDVDSPGVDAGDPNTNYGYERDIDGQFRAIGDAVDIGADETCVDTYLSPADFNDDGIVNLEDYQELAAVWLEDTPPFDPNCDLNADDVIDMIDLSLFTNDWLWFAWACD